MSVNETPEERVRRLEAELKGARADLVESPPLDSAIVYVIVRQGSDADCLEYFDRDCIASTQRGCLISRMHKESDDLGSWGLPKAVAVAKVRMTELSREGLPLDVP